VSELLGFARFKIHEGKLDEFKRLSAQCMEIVRTKDTGTLQYDTYFNDDQSECIVLERFRDSEALIEHAANLGDLSEAILATVSVIHGELLGEPSAELRAKLAGQRGPPSLHALPVDVATARPAWARLLRAVAAFESLTPRPKGGDVSQGPARIRPAPGGRRFAAPYLLSIEESEPPGCSVSERPISYPVKTLMG
jgi:quinol monooxygenase YgiN